MTIDLNVLAKNRDALLLAEVAGLLHDWQKCIDMAVASQWSKNPRLASTSKPDDWKRRGSYLKPKNFADALSRISLQIDSNLSIDLKTLCEEGKDPSSAKNHPNQLVVLLGTCHAEAHVEKELGGQEQPDTACDWISTAFGFENVQPQGLLQPLLDKVLPLLTQISYSNRTNLLSKIQEVFSNAWGDTRRPINEVTLWDWGYSVAALYKSLVAANLIQVNTSSWRLLRVNFDVPGLYAKTIKIGDLLGYKRAVEQACEAVKKLIEEEYPLGNEIYRDSTGIYFTFPDLDLPADLAQEIRRRVEEVEMELAPHIDVTTGDGQTATAQLKSILGKARREALNALAQPFDSQNLSSCWQQQWETVGQGKWEVCPVCGLRPKREDREVCAVCEKRRTGRLSEWLKALEESTQPQPTIWTNEVADKNGRLALLVGKFDLEDWLSGDLVQTMLVKAVPHSPGECTPKNPSPARLRRIWETTQRFWETAFNEKDSEGNPLLPHAPRRLLLRGKLQKEPGAPALEDQPICELLIQGFKLSVVWHEGRFIVCDNPAYFQETTGQLLEEVLHPGSSFPLFTSEGYKKQDQKIGKFTIEEVECSTSYLPFIPILAEPQIFMALVPADRALEVVKAIKARYEREMGKVQNRLPLHLGVVFASRRMPLQAILEAGRAMLQRSVNSEQWTVISNRTCGKVDAPAPLNASAHFEQWQEVRLKNAAGREITLPVSIVMGDGTTPDLWYPYFFVTEFNQTKHQCRFQLRKEGDNDPQKVGAVSGKYADFRLVHVSDLQPDDVVCFTPSTFDFEFLDTASRRFEVYYDENGRRPRRTRPFYLQDVERLENLWEKHFSHLSRSQFSQMLQTIEAARERWDIPPGDEALQNEIFRQFVADTLANASWPKGHAWKDLSDDKQTQLIEAAVRGELADWAEIHLEILKEKMKGE
jgi:hypothetical protein